MSSGYALSDQYGTVMVEYSVVGEAAWLVSICNPSRSPMVVKRAVFENW